MLITKVILKLGLSVFLATLPAAAQSQIAPDGSLPTNVQQLQEIMKINGGERAGNNLFHSFDEFSIPEGMEAIFENALDIQNIFTRITGGDVSNIDGLLKTQGGANLFLINPNGVVFCENVQLDVGGSFIATTADSIEFADNTSFSASDSKPILSIDFPIGLGFGSNSGSITVNGQGNQITNDSTFSPVKFGETPGISVPTGETFALVGNRINFNGGVINSEGAQVYLLSVNLGSVDIDQTENTLSLSDNDTTGYQDIFLNQQSFINASGEIGGGEISLTGKNISLSNGSFILNQNQGNLSSGSGSIKLKASESLTLSGTNPNGGVSSSIRSESLSNTEGANINILANELLLQDDGKIQTGSFDNAKGGNISIDAAKQINLNNSVITASAFAKGNAGNIELSTNQLQVFNGSTLTSSTIGSGNGGRISINASDSIEIIAGDSPARTSISASSFNEGNGGSLSITTDKLRVLDGGSLSSSSFADGNAGNLNINASDLIEVKGKSKTFTGTDPESKIRTAVQNASPAGREIGLPEKATGDAGNLIINTPELNITDEGKVSVENQGSGEGGTVTINADNLNLENAGSITADTASGDGGNIVINTSNLTSKKKGDVSTNAIGGNGGNITITADTLLGIQNSDITANAVEGNGGNIVIDTDFILGFEERVRLTPFSDITATSELGLDGTVTINSPENNSNEDLIISAKEVDFYSNQQLFPDGCNNRNGSRMKIAYLNSGSPESPDDFFDDDEPLSLQSGEESVSYIPEVESEDNVPPLWQEGDPVIEGNMIQTNSDGRVYFVAVDQEKTAESMVCTREAEDRNKK